MTNKDTPRRARRAHGGARMSAGILLDASDDGCRKAVADLLRMTNDDMRRTVKALCQVAVENGTDDAADDIASLLYMALLCLGATVEGMRDV